ncbi:MAG: hypothetical protein EHM70_13610 [Chloroflexota bacterium]|nr:MAG: hypothetical protein EHM70_13610 [Chloroflexota bacterium]
MDGSNISIGLAFVAGIASFLSPCVFSLVPAYVGYLSGRSAAMAGDPEANRWVTFSHGLAFVLGFSVVFVLLGVAASAIGGLLYDASKWLAKIGGIVVIIFGLQMTGVLQKSVRWLHDRFPTGPLGRVSGFLVDMAQYLEFDLRPQSTPDRKMGYLSSALMGVFFSAGWSPCIGPILGSILMLAITDGSITQGAALLSSYSSGLAIPFLIAATQIGLVTKIIRRYGKVMHYVEIGMGVLLVVIGVMLFRGSFETLARFGSFFTAIDEVKVGTYILIGLLAAMALGVIPAFIAYRKGRNFFDWWFFGTGLLIVALPLALWIKPEKDQEIVQTEAQ